MKHRSLYFISCATLSLLVAACGARSTVFYEDGFEPSGAGGAGQGGANQGGANQGGAVSSSQATSITATSTNSSVSVTTVTGTSTAMSSSGAAMTTVSTVASTVASTAVSTGTGMGPMVNCGTATCTNGEVCCFDDDNSNNNFCANPGGCGQGTVELGCMGASDCNQGEVCCAYFQWFGPGPEGYKGAKCVQSCDDPPGPQQSAFLLCSDDPNVCTGNDTCQTSQVLPAGFKYCGD